MSTHIRTKDPERKRKYNSVPGILCNKHPQTPSTTEATGAATGRENDEDHQSKPGKASSLSISFVDQFTSGEAFIFVARRPGRSPGTIAGPKNRLLHTTKSGKGDGSSHHLPPARCRNPGAPVTAGALYTESPELHSGDEGNTGVTRKELENKSRR